MSYRTLKDRSITVSFNGYPWDYTLLFSGMLEAMVAMRDAGNMATEDECVIRTEDSTQKFHRAIEILETLTDDKAFDEFKEEHLMQELFEIFKTDLMKWWN